MSKLFNSIIFFVIILNGWCLMPFAQAQVSNEELGIQFFQNGEYEKAAEIFASIFNKNPDSYIYSYYYTTLLELHDYNTAEKIVKKMAKREENPLKYEVDLGFIYQKSGEEIKAQKIYDKIIANLPSDYYSIVNTADAFLNKGNRDDALKTLYQGRQLQNKPQAFTDDIVKIYEELGEDEKAVTEIINLLSDNDNRYLKNAEKLLQNLLSNDNEDKRYQIVKEKLLTHYQKHPNVFSYSYLLLWLSMQHQEFDIALQQAKSLDKRYKEGGQRLYNLAKIATEHKVYDIAIEALNAITIQGKCSDYFLKAKYLLLDVQFEKATSTYPLNPEDLKKLENEYKNALDEYGIHEGTSEWIKKYARLLAFYLNQPAQAIELLDTTIEHFDIRSINSKKEKAVLKIELADILLYSGDVWAATLNYAQVDKDFPNDTIGHLAKYRNAKLSFYIGEFQWANGQLDVLRAATTKFIANDAMYFSLLISDNIENEGDSISVSLPLKYFAKADFLLYQNKDDEALTMLDSINLLNQPHELYDDILWLKSKIWLKRGNFQKSTALLENLVETYPDALLADEALFELGKINEYDLKDKGKAMYYYEQLIRNYSGSLYIIEARKHYRNLRGDQF